MKNLLSIAGSTALKVVLPSVLAAFGTVMAVLWSEGFRAFCGIG